MPATNVVIKVLILVSTLLLFTDVCTGETKSSIFDFFTAGENQSGQYETSDGAKIEGGLGMLATIYENWFDERWSYRIPLQIISRENLSPAYFGIPLDSAGSFLFDNCEISGTDLRLVTSDSHPAPAWWIQEFSRIARTGKMRVKLDSLGAGTSLWFIYFNGLAEEGYKNEVFSYSSRQPFIYAGNSGSVTISEMVVVAFSDSTHITGAGIDTIISRGNMVTVPADAIPFPHTTISADKPVFALFTSATSDSAPLVILSGKSFVFPAPRNTDIFTVISPYESANVTIEGQSGILDSFEVNRGESAVRHVDISSGAAKISSDVPVLVMHETEEGYDTTTIAPPSTDIIGACAGNCIVGALEDGTEATAYLSNRRTESFTLNSFETHTIGNSGTQGSGPAVRIIANKPVMAFSYADGDGGEMVTFLPTSLLGNEYIIPADSQYLLVSGINPSTRCVLEESGNSTEIVGDTVAPPYPKRFFWGSSTNGANIHAPAFLSCDKPVWAIAERTNGDDEINLWPFEFFTDVQPSIEFQFSSSIETKLSKEFQWITTPNLIPRNGVLKWLGFSIEGESEFPEGTATGYQISTDAGRKWLIVRGGNRWEETAVLNEINSPDEVDRGLQFLPVEDRGQMMVRIVMKSETGTTTPIIDQIRVEYDEIGNVNHFTFPGLPAECLSGIPFNINIYAYDTDGNLVTGFSGPVNLSVEPSEIIIDYPPDHEFISGKATFPVTLSGEGNATIIATYEDASGRGGPILIRSSTGSKLIKVTGDNQFAKAGETLKEPIVVKVVDSNNAGVSMVAVSFTVTQGGGTVSSNTVETDDSGLAQVFWTLGPEPGPNRLLVNAGNIEGSPAEFVARADPANGQTIPESSENGCGCQMVR